jgi:hypothetical protein
MRKISQKPVLTKEQREYLWSLAPLERLRKYRNIQSALNKKKKPLPDTGYGLAGG